MTFDRSINPGESAIANPNGSFVWYELMTEDMTAAENFYSKAIGWETKDSGMPGVTYTILSAGPSGIAAS